MTAFSSRWDTVQCIARSATKPVLVFGKDAARGLAEVCHNSLALVGLALVALLVCVAGQADLRHRVEQSAFNWLQMRHEARQDTAHGPDAAAMVVEPSERDAVSRATAADPKGLDRRQAAVATWLSRRYRVAPEPVSRLVQEAWTVGQRVKLDPTLILAIMAVESSFNPFAQSTVGAQGLMQVMTRIHDDKYVAFGGTNAAFDPVTNLRVGVQVLKECITRAGSLEGGLRFYVGAANALDDGGYAGKVLAEQTYLKSVADGRHVPTTAPLSAPPAPAAIPVTAPPDTPTAAPDPQSASVGPMQPLRVAAR